MTMRAPLLVLVVACSLAAVLLQAAPVASQVNGNGQIAFTSGRGGLFEVWWVGDEDDPSADPLVTGAPGSIEVDPAWDPSASGELAFARKAADDETFDLFVKPPPGSGSAVKVTDEEQGASTDRQPDWSMSSEVAFTRSVRADDTTHIWKVSAGGGAAVQLTSTPAPGYDASPSWSNDGRIAFVSDRTGTPQLWTMSADGSGQTQRTFGSCFVSNPDWSPDDTTIVYEQQCSGGGADLYTVNTATWSSSALLLAVDSDHQPAFAPAGDRILFTRVEPSGDKQLYGVAAPPAPPGTPTPISGNDPEQADMAADWGSFGASMRTEVAPTADQTARTVAAPRTAAKPGGKGSKFRKVTKGVKFLQMRKAKSDVYVLKVDPKKIPRIDTVLSNDALPGHEKTSRMAKRHKAVAGINGDFGTESGRPSHTFAEDGDLKQVSFAVAPTFAITADEQQTTFDRPQETVTAAEQDIWPIERWNFGAPPFTDISAFTPAGGSLEVPPSNACAVRLLPVSGRRWAPNNTGVEVDYAVNEVSCSTTPMALNGGVVLAARPGSDGAILIGSLTSGETVTLTWSIGFPSVLDTVGGTPLLVENGAVVAKPCNESICKRHPRTAIGVTASGRILMVVIDGRSKDSKGVKIVKLAKVMQGLGASFAINLDGGGSSTMVVKGKKGGLQVVNEPSDGNQRKVSSAVLVIKGKDPGEVIGAPIPRQPSAAAPAPANDRAGERAVLDPASTGGLAEALAEGTFGRPVELPRELRRALRAFRSSR
jgi:Phosphodiester glycosidase/WD40-like Beta Propeller Repeat